MGMRAVSGMVTEQSLVNASRQFTIYYASCHLPAISQGIRHSRIPCCYLLPSAAWIEESGQCREHQAALLLGSHALPHGSTALAKDVWKLFWC